ncbi:MAG: hypothetical protein HND51_06120 [Chloroflexi bacterium]|nr:hypothetical protein [Chloroflexota bacterium]
MSWRKVLFAVILLIGLAALIYQIPAVNNRLGWRIVAAEAYVRGVVNPAGELPPPAVVVTQREEPTSQPTPIPTEIFAGPTPTLAPSPTPLPASVQLASPEYEGQDWNNCGPAALSMYLNFYGWEGNQFDISGEIKPAREDRNVNPEELLFYTRNYAGWLNSTFRVGGNIEMLKGFVAAGIPVIVESVFIFDEPFWLDDDRWAAHYLLLTGYDDASQTFTVQDTFRGPDRTITYDQLNVDWQPFNRVFMLVYPPDQESTVQGILGQHWDEDYNRQAAFETAQAEIEADPENAYAWFNLGSNQVYFEQYAQAAQSYDQARTLGLPQRMLRYQFGPFFAYFHSLRTDELITVTSYALQITPNAEEALLWHGWGLFRQGNEASAIAHFQQAYNNNPLSPDAQYALDFMGASP